MQTFPAREHALKTISALASVLDAKDSDRAQIIFLQSEIVTYRHDTDREIAFRQESNFFYLTGWNTPRSFLLLFVPPSKLKSVDSPFQSTLFIPKEDPLETLWSPAPPSLEATRTSHPSFTSVQYTDAAEGFLDSLLSSHPDAIVHTLPTEASYHFPSLPDFLSKKKGEHTQKSLFPALHKARLIKTPFEIELIRKANAISSRAHELIMRLLGKHANSDILAGADEGRLVLPGDWRIEREAEAEAAFVASCRREGALHQAYLPIVAGAERASTLHYCCGNEQFAWGPVQNGHASPDLAHEHTHTGRRLAPQVLLLDAGCEWSNYASDITRTTPIGNGGNFTKEARDIYSLVLKMQNDAFDSLQPGVHWDSVHYQCHVTLVKEFIRLGIFVGSESDILESQISSAFYPHGLGHSIGLDVHDVPSASKPEPESENTTIPELSKKYPAFFRYLRLRLPLQAGMVLTVEPGCYFSPHQLAPVRNSKFINDEVLRRYESVGGVRLEDVVVITPTGAENLTTVGKEVDWVEAISSGTA